MEEENKISNWQNDIKQNREVALKVLAGIKRERKGKTYKTLIIDSKTWIEREIK